MSKTIFRMINGRVVPMVVDEETISNGQAPFYVSTPKHTTKERKLSDQASFTIPNATCQKCGKDVFYYENSFGSRVLFDSLGPPWPVHPCFASYIEKKKEILSAKELGWEPVVIKKTVITSSGSLKVQGVFKSRNIVFTFDEKILVKMRVNAGDAENLIIFGSVEKGKVQTHNGKKTFSTRFEDLKKPSSRINDLPSMEVDNIFGIKNIINDKYTLIDILDDSLLIARAIIQNQKYDKYFSKNNTLPIRKTSEDRPMALKCKSLSHGMYVSLNVLSDKVIFLNHEDSDIQATPDHQEIMRFVGVMRVDKIVPIQIENVNGISIIIRGSLNGSFNVNYLIENPLAASSIYDLDKTSSDDTPLVTLYENNERVEIRIKYSETMVINSDVIVLNNSNAERLIRESSPEIKKPTKKQLHIKKRFKKKENLEDQILKLSEVIPTHMAELFSVAKRRK
ncbi:hypothetical protein ACISK3_09200 [Morganella morganii]|nr:hypothetical protein [Morganella morganii]